MWYLEINIHGQQEDSVGKAFSTSTDNLSSDPQNPQAEGEKQLPTEWSSCLHTTWCACTSTVSDTITHVGAVHVFVVCVCVCV